MSETLKRTTVYSQLEELDTDKAYEMVTQKVTMDDGKETVRYTADIEMIEGEAVAKDDAKWFAGNCVETLTMRSREFDYLKLGVYPVLDDDGKETGETTGHGYRKQYRFFIGNSDTRKAGLKSIDKGELKLLADIRGRLSAVELRLDMKAIQTKLQRKTDNQKVSIDDTTRDSLLDIMSKMLIEGSEYMLKIKRDDDNIVVF